jgi:uncharacterized membrane protein YtjA (UPF0391 family)
MPTPKPAEFIMTQKATCLNIRSSYSFGGNTNMLGWVVFFLVLALLAALFGFGGLAGAAAGIAQILFFVFLVLVVVAFLFGRRTVL